MSTPTMRFVEVAQKAEARTTEIDDARRIPADLIAELAGTGVLKMWVPSAYGGAQADVQDVVDAVADASYHEASLGWSIMIANTTGWTGGHLPVEHGYDVFGDPDAIAGGFAMPAGRAVAAKAGGVLKKTVLELGGSDPYVILEDAALEETVKTCVTSRLINTGQSCIAAKRFVVVEPVLARFESLFVEEMGARKMGDPREADTAVGPLSRHDLRDDLHRQVAESIEVTWPSGIVQTLTDVKANQTITVTEAR